MAKKKLKTQTVEEFWITIDDEGLIWKGDFKPNVNEKIGLIRQKEAKRMETVSENFVFHPYMFMRKGKPTLLRFTTEVVTEVNRSAKTDEKAELDQEAAQNP